MEGITLPIPAKADAVGLWNGDSATILRHRGPVFHKLARDRGGSILMINEEQTVFALMRTTFALFDARTYSPVTAEGILRALIAEKQYRRLLRIHVYLGVIALGKTPVTIQSQVNADQHRFSGHQPKEVIVDGSLHRTVIDEKALDKVSSLLQETELMDNKAMPSEVMDRFKGICGMVYPVEPVTIERPLFAVDGTWVYAVTADASCPELLERIIALNSGYSGDLEVERSTRCLISDDTTVTTDEQVSGDDINATEPTRSENMSNRCIVAVSNFDSIYFLNINTNKKY